MTPEERAEVAYTEWLGRLSEDVRRLMNGSPHRELFVQVVAAAIENAQQTVTLGAGTTELPHHPRP